jgi:hypothetical protein
MWEKLLDYAIASGAGIFAILFILLLAWVLKTNNDREIRYIGITEKLAVSLSCVENIQKDVDDIKSWILRKDNG